MRRRLQHGLAAIAVSALPVTAVAEHRPLWEIGVGAGALTLPVYRGSAESESLLLPVIYPVYRGDIVRVDDQGLRGLLLRSQRTELDFSIDAGIPADSDNVDVRAGMPDLDPSLQLGPSLKLSVWRRARAAQSLVLNLPLRAVATVSSDPDAIGFTFSPHLTYYRDVPFAGRDWRLGLSGGFEWGSSRFHDYFYGVDPQFATADRPAYEAEAGYAGTRLILTFHSYTPRNWFSVFARYDRVDAAVFEDSPLVGRSDGLTVGVVLSWFIARSSRQVEHQPDGLF